MLEFKIIKIRWFDNSCEPASLCTLPLKDLFQNNTKMIIKFTWLFISQRTIIFSLEFPISHTNSWMIYYTLFCLIQNLVKEYLDSLILNNYTYIYKFNACKYLLLTRLLSRWKKKFAHVFWYILWKPLSNLTKIS